MSLRGCEAAQVARASSRGSQATWSWGDLSIPSPTAHARQPTQRRPCPGRRVHSRWNGFFFGLWASRLVRTLRILPRDRIFKGLDDVGVLLLTDLHGSIVSPDERRCRERFAFDSVDARWHGCCLYGV